VAAAVAPGAPEDVPAPSANAVDGSGVVNAADGSGVVENAPDAPPPDAKGFKTQGGKANSSKKK
jgi:hypothetical protein